MSGFKSAAKQSARSGIKPADAVVTAADQALNAGKLTPSTAIPVTASWQPSSSADPLLGLGGFSVQAGVAFVSHPVSQTGKIGQAGKTSSASTSTVPLPTDKTVSTILGEITWLMTQSPQHKQLSIDDLEWQE